MKLRIMLAVLALVLVNVWPSAAQTTKPAAGLESHHAVRLGGATRFSAPIKDVAALQKLYVRPRMQTDLRKVFADAGIDSLADQFLKAVSDGAVKETSVPVGSEMEWMASRSASTTRPHLIRRVTWSGAKPFEAFEIVLDDLNKTYTFWIPKVCGNVTLATSEPSREKARQEAAKAEQARLDQERRDRELAAEKARQDAAAKQAAEQARLEQERAAAAAAATAAAAEKDRLEKERAAAAAAAGEKGRVAKGGGAAAAAAAGEKGRLGQERSAATAAEEAERDRLEKVNFFVGGYVGKERRVRDVSASRGVTDRTIESGICAPLVGFKGGVAFRVNKARTFEVAPAAGVAFNTKTGGNSSLFAEVELNGRLNNKKTIVGTGFGVWDLTDSGMVAPTVLVNFGQQIWQNQTTSRIYFAVEGRVFLNRTGDLANNYQFWGGARYVWR